MQQNVEALIQAAAAPGPGVITDDREVPPPVDPNAAPAVPPVDAGVKASTEPVLSPEEAEVQALMREMDAATVKPAGTTAPAATPAAATPTTPAATPAAEAIAALSGQPAAPAAPAPSPAAGTQPQVDGRTAALRAEREARRKAEQTAAYWQGVAEAREHAQASAATPAAPVETPEEQIAARRKAQQALAQQFDSATITAAAWEAERQKLEDEIANIRLQAVQPAQAAPVQPPADLTLEHHSQQLAVQYPVLNLLQSEDLEPLVAIAYQQAAREGRPIQNGTATGTLDLRTRVAKIATTTYADVLAAATAAGQVVAPANAAPAPSGDLSPDAAARDAKLRAAAGFPPNVNQLGTAAGTVQPSEAELDARLANLSPAEADNLLLSMPAMVKKLTGVDIPPQRR